MSIRITQSKDLAICRFSYKIIHWLSTASSAKNVPYIVNGVSFIKDNGFWGIYHLSYLRLSEMTRVFQLQPQPPRNSAGSKERQQNKTDKRRRIDKDLAAKRVADISTRIPRIINTCFPIWGMSLKKYLSFGCIRLALAKSYLQSI